MCNQRLNPNNKYAIAQLKFHLYFGGGEVYARFLAESLSRLNLSNIIFTHPKAKYWSQLKLPTKTHRINAGTINEVIKKLPQGVPLITHAPLNNKYIEIIRRTNPMFCIVHMPFTGNASDFYGYKRVFGVSEHVNNSLRAKGIIPWHTPLLGVADLNRNIHHASVSVCKKSEFDWDNKKIRDRVLGWSEPAWSIFRPNHCFKPDPSILTIGVVSRISTIKKFPKLFSILTPILHAFPEVYIEFFGAGGYAQVRDLRKVLHPISRQVRFWGHQDNVVSVYKKVDFVLAGLPEREALGLNLIEAQQLGTPVIAVDAPPFTETVSNGITGWLYTDPREDNGTDFKKLLTGITNGELTLNHAKRREHLDKFSINAFSERLYHAIKDFI